LQNLSIVPRTSESSEESAVPVSGSAALSPRGSDKSARAARLRVLKTLGLAEVVGADYLDIEAGHRAHVEVQRSPAIFDIDGLTIVAPGGVYHPTPESSSLLFIRNIQALNMPAIPRMLEIGAGCGAICLFVAHRWRSHVVATDISDESLQVMRENAERNRLSPRILKSDLFNAVDERDFDLIVFNVPMIDKEPEDDLERESLCDPGGRILRRFLEGVPAYLDPGGLCLFSICSNTAYDRLEGIDLNFRVIGLELVGAGFWRAIIGAERR
jgi:methylase of polypeptide subunit release factors